MFEKIGYSTDHVFKNWKLIRAPYEVQLILIIGMSRVFKSDQAARFHFFKENTV